MNLDHAKLGPCTQQMGRGGVRSGDGDGETFAVGVLPALEEPPGDVAVDVDILGGGVGVGARGGEASCTAEHGENNWERLFRVVEGDVENGRGVDDGVYGFVVVDT